MFGLVDSQSVFFGTNKSHLHCLCSSTPAAVFSCWILACESAVKLLEETVCQTAHFWAFLTSKIVENSVVYRIDGENWCVVHIYPKMLLAQSLSLVSRLMINILM